MRSPSPDSEPAVRKSEDDDRIARARHVMRAFRGDVRKRRGKLFGGAFFALVYAISRVIEPWPLKVVFDQVLFHKKAHGFFTNIFTVFGTSANALLLAAALALALAGIVRGVSYYWEDYLLSSAAQQIVYGIRARLYRHLHVLSLSFHQRRRTGDLLVRLSADIVVLRDVLIDFVVNLLSGAVMVLLMLAVMVAVDPLLTAVSLVAMPTIVGLSWLYGRQIRRNASKQRKREGQVAAVMHEALAAMSVVQLHGASAREQERFHEINRRSLKKGVQGARLEAKMNRSIELALAGGTVVILWVGTLRALHGALTPGDLVVFISYLRAAYRPLRRTSKSVQRSAKALAAAERIVEVLDTEPELTDAPDAQPAPVLRGEVTFDAVDFSYEPGRRVLESVSFTAPPGRRIAVVGATGSGKSTLLSLVPRLFDPDSGRVLLDGADVRSYTLESVRSQISTVQQEPILFGLSVAENIRYGAPDASDEEVRAAAHAAGMDDFVEQLPEGYDTVLSERGASLSGGQRQRVTIARALVRKSPILILDEPTSGLDAATERGILDALRGLMAQTTTLLVTHHMELVREADEIIVLQHGRIVDHGRYKELLERSSAFRRLAAPRGEPEPPSQHSDGPEGLQASAESARKASPPGRARASGGDTEKTGVRALFYSHNGVGVGHLQRQLDLAAAFKARHQSAAVLLATGSHAAGMFPIPRGLDYIKLPSVTMVGRGQLWDARELPIEAREVIRFRAELLEQTMRQFAPDLLVADFMPPGPEGELVGALELLRSRGGAAVAGFRDVIDRPEYVRELWHRTGTYDVLRAYYDLICVYGDPAMIDFPREYDFDAELSARTRYCGYIGRRPLAATEAPLYERPLVLANGGGGVDSVPLLEAFISASGRLRAKHGGTWLLVTGPLMDDAAHDRLARSGEAAGLVVRRVVPELRAHVALADCVVTMAGYNTCCDLLTFRRPAVLVPRSGPNQEQRMRAEQLRRWGFARVVDGAELAPGLLATQIEAALNGETPPPAPVPLDGLKRSVDAFDEALTKSRLAA